MSDWQGETIDELRHALAEGAVTSEALTARCLARIEADGARLNAFITVTAERALEAARAADRAAAAGRATTALHGIPISLKDLIDEAGVPTTAASRVRDGVVAASDAPVTARLRAAGAVFVGKTNLHEFALGPTGDDSAYGPCRHPQDPARVAGGSSGGSAIAVATGMSIASIGSDTGGSIRVPAAACGVVGLKPGWGEIPAGGVVPLSRQLDHVGPLARTVTDAWLVHETLAGRPPARSAALDPRALPRLRLGRLRGYFEAHLDDEVAAVYEHALARLRAAGATIVDVTIPLADTIASVYAHLALADAAAYHADTLERRAGDYTGNVRLRLEMGRTILAEDYVRALQGREAIARGLDDALASVDALVCPTLPVVAPPVGAATVVIGATSEPVRNALLRLTQPFNVGRQPAITLPCGTSRAAGLPVGLQLAGVTGHTTALLRLALAVERALHAERAPYR